MRYVLAAVLLSASCAQLPAAPNWNVVSACWRQDENPWTKQQVWDGWYWAEGWSNEEQFWPKYFEPAGSLHIVLRNDSRKASTIELSDVDGRKIEDILTTRDRAGQVIWRNVFPEKTAPGGWAECIVRLRHTPGKNVRLGFTADQQRVEVTVPVKPSRVRIESVSFSPRIDRLYVYVRALDGNAVKPGKVRLDFTDATKCDWSQWPRGSGVLLAEVGLKPAWELGSYHLVEFSLSDGTHLAYPVRAYDSYFPIGLFGTTDEQRVKEAVERGFNTYVIGRESKLLDDVGINYVVRSGLGEGRMRIPGKQSGTLFYNNVDEPDADDVDSGKNLPYMERLGVDAELQVLPRYWQHFHADPRTPSMVLVDSTYRPLNYYVYGQTSDVFCTDPYVPLAGDQVQMIAHNLEVARDASAPCPLIATLWCTSMGQRPGAQYRFATPEEERMMTFYALGAGVKGLFYFADRDTPTGENLVSVVHNRPLWDEMGRINKDVAVLAPLLSVGCPVGAPKENDKVWYRSIMCGPDAMVVVVVNKGHHIGYNTQRGIAWHFPAKDVQLRAALPEQFKKCRVEEVKDGELVPAKAVLGPGQVSFTLDVVDTARALVISAE